MEEVAKMTTKTKIKIKISIWRHKLYRFIYLKRLALCRDIVKEEMVQCLHPDFGWYWQEDGEGYKLMEQARNDGIQEGRVQTMQIVDDSVLAKDDLIQQVLELKNKLAKYEAGVGIGRQSISGKVVIGADERKALLNIDIENG